MTALEAKFAAQKIAFGPLMFQAVRVLRDSGILEAIHDSRLGLTTNEIVRQTGVSRYGVRVLTEAGLGTDVLRLRDDGRFSVTKTGWFFINDELTRVNMDFANDVCYQGMRDLDGAIENETPLGLKVFGDWDTIYSALPSLPDPVRKSWLAFDHFYSDAAFPEAFPLVFDPAPVKLLDVGGNTGRWALHCLANDPDVNVTIADLPGQLAMAEEAVTSAGYADRVHYHAIDLLDPTQALPDGHGAIWMSQFLCCFSEGEIASILERARDAMRDDTRLFILDTYWDRQEHEMTSFCLQASSLYFTALANGNSRMYRAQDILDCIAGAGLRVEDDRDQIAHGHTLFRCRKPVESHHG